MWQNKSFVFFREIEVADPSLGAVGAAGTHLTPLHSMAVDRSLWMFGMPAWIETAYPPEARDRGVAGFVLVQFYLPDDGKPVRPVAVLSEPVGLFEPSALEHLSKIRFSVPPEWVAAHPNRIVEVAFLYQVYGSPDRPRYTFSWLPTIVTTMRRLR